MSNINSFTEVTNELIQQVNIALENVIKLNESITTQDDTVTLSVEQTNPVTGDASIVTYSLPSYNNVINKVNALHQTMDTFIKGEGVVLLNDGTYRRVTTNPIAVSPSKITNVATPTKFTTRSNWFFESMMEPQLIVSFDLKNKIDDRSDRVKVKRVLFDNFDDEETQWFLDNITSTERTYYDTITYLNESGKKYWEDEEVQDLPLLTEPYSGYFLITNKRTISGKEWFYLDTMKYGETTDTPLVKNYQLAIGDLLRYGNSIWKIDDINISENRVHLVANIGMDHPTINNSFEIYSTPFSTKQLDIPVGYDECDIIFLKGVNDDFNIVADEWSNGISFYTNTLTLKNTNTTLANYYITYISDFGRQLEGQVKENFVPAYYGIQPDPPTFTADNFLVKQINTQLNAALDTELIKNTQADIEKVKSYITSLRNSISLQKAEMISLTDAGSRADLQSKIDSNNDQLSKATVQYQSYVRSLSTIAYENSAVVVNPKYRLRGFFDIPKPKGTPGQQIIQFEYAYRYLKLDNTGNALNTYEYTDPSTGQKIKGVFTDWNIVSTPIKQKAFNSSLNIYEWIDEVVSDGEAVNINSVDIPIQKGEKVQLKIRSISEAGWPLNPLKSEWSNTIIKDFPANLEGTDQITNILSDAITEQNAITLDQTLSSAGITTHIDDNIPNPNSGTGTYFKHQSKYLAHDIKVKSTAGVNTSSTTTDLQSHLENIASNTYITLTRPSGSASAWNQISGTLQMFLQSIVDASAGIYDKFVDNLT